MAWGQIRFPTENGSDPELIRYLTEIHPRMAWIYRSVAGKLSGGAVWLCRTVGAIEPPRVRALCLRSTASQAPERTAAGGWAGPRSGVYGASCTATPPRHPAECQLWLLLRLLLERFGRCRAQPCRTPLLDLHVDHAVADAGPQGVTGLYLINLPHQGAIIAAGQDAVATRHGRQRADCFK